jgi:hypothetical protein
MNPPYDKNLHLKILREAMKHIEKEGGEIVSLQPCSWVQDPVSFYKRGGCRKPYKDIEDHIVDLKVIPSLEAEAYFNISIPFNLGIYKIDNKGGWNNPYDSSLLCKMIDNLKDTLQNHIVDDKLTGICELISLFTGGGGGRLVNAIFFNEKKSSYFTDGVNDYTGKTYKEQRTEKAWGNVTIKDHHENVKFATKEERDNFNESWNTKCLRWMFKKMTVDVHVHPQFLPFLPTYKKQWDDKQLYEYFNLTPEEIKIIEEEMR